ncbi:hypothetical protein HELRODRAFT_76804 [Helobdella robusta]|uniref:PNPLA domain-containing protein n=1 Tax=Helobdella robusta TaxID=6412 RepID=T1G2P6_HELRO|nr:hypothetical protein HELRODRAFT_76804 [Helobdella robusta]ESO07389.1 hypothetical protein HELRODRAFT_76804 [Helobdella robusta]
MRSEFSSNNINDDNNNNKLTTINNYINQSLCLLGHVEPLRHSGLRVLTLDGGGTRGLITINILKQLEQHTGRRIYELFDYVCGVSTGALIGIIAGAFRISLSKTEEIYKKFSRKMFARNRLAGVGKLFMSHAYYDTEFWEDLLQNNIGSRSFVDTMMDVECPKLSIVSTLMNAPRVQNYLFRNYNHPSDRPSRYWGSVEHRLWQSIRASSAAPGYFEEFELAGLIHQDGGLLTNNPTAVALHECKLLWPTAPIQCIVSIGTGKYEAKSSSDLAVKSSLKAKIMKIIESATDTEGVHMVLHDLLPPSTYFRFNPPLSEGFLMDETREEKWSLMLADSQMYCRKNQVGR